MIAFLKWRKSSAQSPLTLRRSRLSSIAQKCHRFPDQKKPVRRKQLSQSLMINLCHIVVYQMIAGFGHSLPKWSRIGWCPLLGTLSLADNHGRDLRKGRML